MSDDRLDLDPADTGAPARRPRRADTGASPRGSRPRRRERTPAAWRRDDPGDVHVPLEDDDPIAPLGDGNAPERAATSGAYAPAPTGPDPETRLDHDVERHDERHDEHDLGPGVAPDAEVDAGDSDVVGRRGPGRGARRARGSRARRRQARTRTGLVVAALAVVALVVVVIAFNLVDRARELIEPEPEPTPDALAGDPQPVVTLITTREGADGTEVASVALLTVDRPSGEGTILLVPPATVADVPGHGSFRLSEAFDFGGASLAAVSIDNLLGIRSDAVATVAETGWVSMVDRLGGVDVTLSEPVVDRAEDGSGEVLMDAGSQMVGGQGLATLLAFRSPDESQLDQLPRVQAALIGLLDRFSTDPDALPTMFAADAPEVDVSRAAPEGEGDAAVDAKVVRRVLSELSAARNGDQVTTLTLFVSPLGTGTEDAYRPDQERIEALVDDRFAASRPDPGVAGGRTLQLLNGNGVPGIGAEVAAVLQPAGYRVLLTGNADRFTYEVTRIVVYDEEPGTLAAARDVRDRLGVGAIERSGTPQSVVDLTVVIGRDFPVGGVDASGDAEELADDGDAADDGAADAEG